MDQPMIACATAVTDSAYGNLLMFLGLVMFLFFLMWLTRK